MPAKSFLSTVFPFISTSNSFRYDFYVIMNHAISISISMYIVQPKVIRKMDGIHFNQKWKMMFSIGSFSENLLAQVVWEILFTKHSEIWNSFWEIVDEHEHIFGHFECFRFAHFQFPMLKKKASSMELLLFFSVLSVDEATNSHDNILTKKSKQI